MTALFLCWFYELGLGYASGFLLGGCTDMGCGGSKVDDLPLVIRCRERKELLKAAANHRYSLSSAHILYISSLKDVGEALCRFVDEEFVTGSPLDSPVLTLPSDEGKKNKKNINSTSRNVGGGHNKSPSNSNSGSVSHVHSVEDEYGDLHDSHLHLSSSSDSELGSPSGHIHVDGSPEIGHIHIDSPEISTRDVRTSPYDRAWEPYGYGINSNPPPQSAWGPYGYGMNAPPQTDWGPYGMNVVDQPYGMNQPYQTDWGNYGGNSNSYAYYMKSSGPSVRTVIHGEEEPNAYVSSYSSYPNENGGFFDFTMSSQRQEPPGSKRPSPPAGPPPPPPPSGSGWDFLNPFDGYENGYPGYYSQNAYEYGSIGSSPDSNEVRQREGIPDLEEETENEVFKGVDKGKNVNESLKRNFGKRTYNKSPPKKGGDSSRTVTSHSSDGSSREVPFHSGEGGSRAMPKQYSEGTSKAVPSYSNEGKPSVNIEDEKSSHDTIATKSSDDSFSQKKGVTFEVEEVLIHEIESSKTSSLTTLSSHGSQDIQDVVNAIKDEFEVASSYGKEVALMLEVGKLPYLPKLSVLKVTLSRIMCLKALSSASSHSTSRPSIRVDSRTMKLARSYYEDAEKDTGVYHSNISSILEELYAWEKKLYKEVKDEERLRLTYEKLCKKLKALDESGAETSKIDSTRVSVRKLLTRLNVCIKGIDAISSRIHKLRDNDLQPQVAKLIHGLIRMWKFMLKCHQKQFKAIMESKTRNFRANTGFQRDSKLRATLELEMELRTWCCYFDDWIKAQKSYVECLNGWLLQCLHYEPEVTADGIVPFSPGRIGAPPIFVVCNDWHQAMGTINETGVATAMQHFASNLRQLWERQDEEQRHRLKAEYLSKDFDKQMKMLRGERGKQNRNQDAMSTIVASESGVSPHDDLKVDLDSMRKRLEEERARHNDAMKLVNDAASSSLQGGLVPIFKALENFSSEALKALEQVRLQNSGQGS